MFFVIKWSKKQMQNNTIFWIKYMCVLLVLRMFLYLDQIFYNSYLHDMHIPAISYPYQLFMFAYQL